MTKLTAKNEPPPLARSWSAPATVPGCDDGPGRPVGCFATTYTFSAEFLETELLPRFLGLEFDPAEQEPSFLVEREDALAQVSAAILVDQTKVDVRQTTLRWDQVPVRVSRGIQHAKVTALAWERLVRLTVGSANLTVPGYRHNREVVATLDFFDHEDSPPRTVLLDALGFLETLLQFAAAEAKVIGRVRTGIGEIQSRVRKWSRMPREFGPREFPRMSFVANLPNSDGTVARSVLRQVEELWADRKARDIRVMTPFVGDVASGASQVTETLARLPRLRSADVRLAVPGRAGENHSAKPVVNLPRRFRDAWAAAWGQKVDGLDMCIITPDAEHRGRPVSRPLHAKGLFLSDGTVSLLCCGSSNFTAGGMGIGRANAEANLCFVDRATSDLDGSGLEYRLPVDWEHDRARSAEWLDEPEPATEDAETAGNLVPSVFRWAILDPRLALLKVGLDPAEQLPAGWAIRLPHPGAAALASYRDDPVLPASGLLLIKVPAEAAAVPVAMVRLTWDATPGEALLPVHLEDPGTLPPPESLQGLTAEDILACLLSGCSPAEWVHRKGNRRRGGPPGNRADPALNPHHVHDPSGLALYRVRRLGRALTTLGRRIETTVRTAEAVEYHVHQYPLGPVRLAEALVPPAAETAGTPSAMDRACRVFSLLEIALVVGHTGKRLHRLRQAGEADHRPCFRRAVNRILRWADEGAGADAVDDGHDPGNLHRYRNSVEAELARLLGGLENVGGSPCP